MTLAERLRWWRMASETARALREHPHWPDKERQGIWAAVQADLASHFLGDVALWPHPLLLPPP